MKNVIIIHGWGADSQSNWFPWLKAEFEKQGVSTIVPNFPNTQNPKLFQWLKFFNENIKTDKETILVGHSLGVPFILRILEQLPENQKVKGALLVAGFERSLGIPEIDNFVEKPFNWEKIKSKAEKFIVISSDNDPYIPLEIGQNLTQKLSATFIVEKGQGHLNAPAGFLEYPKVLKLIEKI